jgi:predicted DNA-binding transcriptional regulator AlpA
MNLGRLVHDDGDDWDLADRHSGCRHHCPRYWKSVRAYRRCPAALFSAWCRMPAVRCGRSGDAGAPAGHGYRRHHPALGLEPLLDVNELAAYLGVPVSSTVYDWRTNGKGPRAFLFGKRLKFAISDVRTWIGQHRDPDPDPLDPPDPGDRRGPL